MSLQPIRSLQRTMKVLGERRADSNIFRAESGAADRFLANSLKVNILELRFMK
jgi:hypothetical protein